MNVNSPITDNQLINLILGHCTKGNSIIYITGTGCSGKTTLSLKMASIIEKAGKTANCIHMDDFLTNSDVRKAGVKNWVSDGVEFKGRYTSCCKESYYIAAADAALFALNNKKTQYIKTKNGNFDLIDSNADLTLIEGLGIPFISQTPSLKIFLECDEQIELHRRIKRDCARLHKSEEEIVADSIDRRHQYRKYILPYKSHCDLVLKSNDDFTFSALSDKIGLIL